MRSGFRVVFAAAALIGVAAFAFAQETPAPATFEPEWEAQIDPEEWYRRYPTRALEGGAPGYVVLCCTPREDRRLDCATGLEWPRGFGFGAAANTLARGYQLSEASYASHQSTPGAVIQLPFVFDVRPLARRYHWERRQPELDAESAGLCARLATQADAE